MNLLRRFQFPPTLRLRSVQARRIKSVYSGARESRKLDFINIVEETYENKFF